MSKYRFNNQSYYYSLLRETTGALPLHEAAKQGDLYILKGLSDEKANLEARDNKGRTALHYAAMFNQRKAYDILLDKGADSNLKDKFGYSPKDVIDSKSEVQVLGEEQCCIDFCCIS